MNASTGPDTFWLGFVNVGLGLVALFCVLLVGSGIVRELGRRLARRRTAVRTDTRSTP